MLPTAIYNDTLFLLTNNLSNFSISSAMKKVKLKEGDIFLLPLTTGGFTIGLLARVKWGALGYFFKIRYSQAPESIDVGFLTKENVIYIGKFGTPLLKNGEWQIIGKIPNWDRDYWNIPKFKASDLLIPNQHYLITIDDSLYEITREVCTKEAQEGLFEAVTSGYEAICIKVTKILEDLGLTL